ncbi:MAG: CvpA family protein [Patescibacteria group bacterium]|nr:CvpA family protein [Patescibacteria group bacterium]
MTVLDLILILILVGFCLSGVKYGFIHSLGSIVGVVFGVYFASKWYPLVVEKIAPILFGQERLVALLAFVIIFILFNRVIGIVFYFLGKMFGIVAFVPFLKTFNRILGGVLSVFEGILVLGVIFYFYSRYPIWPALNEAMINSRIIPFALNIIKILMPIIPEGVKQLDSVMDQHGVNQVIEENLDKGLDKAIEGASQGLEKAVEGGGLNVE